jgi:hypothetical protein
LSTIKYFTKEEADGFFQLLRLELQALTFDPFKMGNVDETGIMTVQVMDSKVIRVEEGRGQSG